MSYRLPPIEGSIETRGRSGPSMHGLCALNHGSMGLMFENTKKVFGESKQRTINGHQPL